MWKFCASVSRNSVEWLGQIMYLGIELQMQEREGEVVVRLDEVVRTGETYTIALRRAARAWVVQHHTNACSGRRGVRFAVAEGSVTRNG